MTENDKLVELTTNSEMVKDRIIAEYWTFLEEASEAYDGWVVLNCIRKYKESQDKHNNLSQEEKDRILSDCYNKDDKRWAEITKIYEESQNSRRF